MPLIRIASAFDIPKGGKKEIELEGKTIALFKYNGSFYAINGICLHRAGSLAEGELDENIISCPNHGWKYDIIDGKCLNTRGFTESYKTQAQGGDVFIEI
ncbi:MAG: Rieske (2Fe-2S) protein [Candidatus Micrarchaeota archaeon]